jgi:hypothetical protein
MFFEGVFEKLEGMQYIPNREFGLRFMLPAGWILSIPSIGHISTFKVWLRVA